MKSLFSIGSVQAYPLVLAPMEDVSDIAFRMTCKHYGAGIVYTEMTHSASIVRGNDRRAITVKDEQPVGVQVAGRDIAEVVEAAKDIEKHANLIDINLGCPGPNVIARGYGSALLQDLPQIGRIISALVEGVKVPVTAKMRAGYKDDADALQIAQTIEDAGASALGVHPRTKSQKYAGKADWSLIADIKQQLSIPVIGNGDVVSALDAKRMFEDTNCDAVMIGRGAIGDPMIFERCRVFLDEGELIVSGAEDKIKGFELYLKYAKQFGLIMKTRVLRQAQQFSKGMEGSVELRRKLMRMNDIDKIVEMTKEFLSK